MVIDIVPGTRLLVFGNRPSDLVAGAGGLIALTQEYGGVTQVVTFSPAQSSPRHASRVQSDVLVAYGMLGVSSSTTWSIEELGMYLEVDIYRECVRLIRTYKPWIIATHGDHEQATDMLAVNRVAELARIAAGRPIYPQLGAPWTTGLVVYYECEQPIPRPHIIVDISSVAKTKWKALKRLASNRWSRSYQRAIGLSRLRGAGIDTAFGEAYRISDCQPIQPDI